MSDEGYQSSLNILDLYEADVPVKALNVFATEYKVLFRLIYCCGLRNNDTCTLKLADVDTDSGKLTIIHVKGNKDRIVYLAGWCMSVMYWIQTMVRKGTARYIRVVLGKYRDKCIPKTSVDRMFNEFWSSTQTSQKCDKNQLCIVCAMPLWLKDKLDGVRHQSPGNDALSQQLSWAQRAAGIVLLLPFSSGSVWYSPAQGHHNVPRDSEVQHEE